MPRTLVSRFTVRGKTKRIMLVAVAIGMAVSTAAFVSAHQSPGGCNSNRLNLSIVKDKTDVHQGEVLTYSVTISNQNSGSDIACDITDAVITLRLPAADGTPTGTLVTLENDLDIPGGTGVTAVGSVPYTVNVNPGVVDIVSQGRAIGVLHDAPTNHSAEIIKTLGTSVVADAEDSADANAAEPRANSSTQNSILFDESRK